MFLGRWEIDDLLTFAVNTHTPSTGAGTDADAVPAYRVYEDETGTAILTGNMAKLDDANTVGFYSEQITLSAANGFEVGKSYTIYVAAVVGGVTGTLSHSFQVEAALNNLSIAQVNAEVDAAIETYHLDHLLAVAYDPASKPGAADALLNELVENDGGISRYTANSLEQAHTAPTVGQVADAVWDEAIAGHLLAGSTGLKLNSSGSGTSFPAGAIEFTYTVTNSVTGDPIDGVEIWISTDNPATNIVWKGETDAFGIAMDVLGSKPMLDAGTYYIFRQLAGFLFQNPDTEVVSA